jgi:NAD(P)-dependent dehydrogenase (short-subunit alcohol dehydrogenase family)
MTVVAVVLAMPRSARHDNVLGVVRVTNAMLALLRRSKAPVIVNVSSALGSFAAVNDPNRIESNFALLGYCSSKWP